MIPTRFQPLVQIAYAMLPNMICRGCGSQHFSFVLKSSKVLAIGVNHYFKSHPLAQRYNHRFASIHSEMAALVQVRHKHDLKSLTLVNIRLSSDSLKEQRPILRKAKPCKNCLALLRVFEFGKVFYSTDYTIEKLRI